MSYGLLGGLQGLGEGLSDYGQAMQKDALEKRRQERLEKARRQAERRANKEWNRRNETTYGQQVDMYGMKREDAEKDWERQRGAAVEDRDISMAEQRRREEEAHRRNLERDTHRAQLEMTQAEMLAAVKEGSGGAEISTSDANHMWRMAADMFGGRLQEDGSIFLPEGARDDAMKVYRRAGDLMSRNVPRHEAMDIAYKSVTQGITAEQAREEARKAVPKTGGFLGINARRDPDSVDAEQQRIMGERNQAARQYESLMGRGGPPSRPQEPTRSDQPPAPQSKEEYDRIPSGTMYLAPDGTMRKKP